MSGKEENTNIKTAQSEPNDSNTDNNNESIEKSNSKSASNPWAAVNTKVKQAPPGARPSTARAVSPRTKAQSKPKSKSPSKKSNKGKNNRNSKQQDSSKARRKGGNKEHNKLPKRISPSAPENFSLETFQNELYKFAENNSDKPGAPLYWYKPEISTWMAGVGANSLGQRPFFNVTPVFFEFYPYPVQYLRHATRRKHLVTPQERAEFALKIVNGQVPAIDKRTTLMIRNIPNKYTQDMLLDEISEFLASFDLLYLPVDVYPQVVDKQEHVNVGYAFLNFVSPERIGPFYSKFQSHKWKLFGSSKICELTYARIQGRQAMLDHFYASRVLVDNPQFRPILFDERGNRINDADWPTTPKSVDREFNVRRGSEGFDPSPQPDAFNALSYGRMRADCEEFVLPSH